MTVIFRGYPLYLSVIDLWLFYCALEALRNHEDDGVGCITNAAEKIFDY